MKHCIIFLGLLTLCVSCTSKTSKTNKETKKDSVIVESNGHSYIDLGLPSGKLWATMNVGAESPSDYGAYFSWGEIVSKSNYSWNTYKWGDGHSFIKYNADIDNTFGPVDNKTTLDKEDDAAAVNWGGNWYTPTSDDWAELSNKDNCTWLFTNQNGVNGQVVTSRINGNSIFLPAAGVYYDQYIDFKGKHAEYWSSSLCKAVPYKAYILSFGVGGVSCNEGNERRDGRPVRPVLRQ